MIDSHSHIDASAFDEDRGEMLDRAFSSGIEMIVVPDIEPPRRTALKAIVDAHPKLVRGVGIHPHHVGNAAAADLEQVDLQCTEAKVVAIGEIGLDYYYDFCPRDVQKLYFREQLRIAKARSLPVIIHNREADEDMLSILKEEQDGSLRGVLHCFSSDVAMLETALELGMHVSFTGNITFAKSTLSAVVDRVPLDRVMIETDAPYITPVPHRGKRNEPSFVRYVAEKIAEIKGMTMNEITSATTVNAKKFFGLMVALVAVASLASAQPKRPIDEDYDRDLDYELAMDTYEADSIGWLKFVKPKTFAFGFTVGSNTVVEQQTYTQRYYRAVHGTTTPQRWVTFPQDSGPSRSFSYEGLTSFGATMLYQLSDKFTSEVSYIYTKNVGDRALYGLQPIVTSVFEGTMLYSLNPYNKINFSPQIGITYAVTDDGKVNTQFGINGGMGIGINIPTSFGLFYPMFNVRFNFMLGTDQQRIISKHPVEDYENPVNIVPDPDNPGRFLHADPTNPSRTSVDRADVTTIYSIPRLSIMFFPNF